MTFRCALTQASPRMASGCPAEGFSLKALSLSCTAKTDSSWRALQWDCVWNTWNEPSAESQVISPCVCRKVKCSPPPPYHMEATHMMGMWPLGYRAGCQTGWHLGMHSASKLILQPDGGACVWGQGWGRGEMHLDITNNHPPSLSQLSSDLSPFLSMQESNSDNIGAIY